MRNGIISAAVLIFIMALPAIAAAGVEPNLIDNQHWHGRNDDAASFKLVDQPTAPGAPAGPILQISVKKPSTPFYDIQVTQPVAAALPADHLIELHFSARSVDHNPVRAVMEMTAAPYTAITDGMFTLKSAWQTYDYRAVSTGYANGALSVRFQVGMQKGTIEIANVSVTDLGIDPQIIAARAAITPSAIAQRIDRYRKRTLHISVIDAAGAAVPMAKINLHETRQAFWFGCNIFSLEPDNHNALQLEYQKRFTALFNYATLPFYWGSYEGREGHPNAARLHAMADWCNAHGITPKGHPLVWHEVYPAWAPMSADAAIPLLHDRVTDLVKGFRGSVDVWDVVNEANAAALSPPNGETAWVKRDGPATVVGQALTWARAAGKGTPEIFTYNDYDIGQNNINLLTQLQKKQELPDVIGIQSHMHGGTWPMTKVWMVAQRFSQFGLPIHFTETTVLSGPKRVFNSNAPPATDWNTTPEGEKAQADYLVDFYTLLFSHPNLQAITYWDLSDHNAWLGAPAGLLRKDMSPKPSYDRLMHLIHHDWETNEDLTADKTGSATPRVFCGEYELTATDASGHQMKMKFTVPQPTVGENAPNDPIDVTVRMK